MKVFFSIVVLMSLCAVVIAQPTRPRPPCFPPSKCIPIDGGVIALALAGLAIGGSKLKRKS